MMRAHLNKALLVSASMLLASTAFAQSPNASPQGKAQAAEGAKKADDKKAEKADDKKADEKGKSGDHAARVARQHEDQKSKLQGMLKGPMDSSVKEELKRHAERVARIERVKSVATDAKDNDSTDRAGKLLAKENARHDKWMEKHVASSATAGAAGTPVPAAVPPAAPDTKGGAK